MASHEVSSSHDSQNCPSQGTSAFENGLERDEELSGDTSQAAVNLQLLEEISNHERALQEENRRLEDRLHAAELYILNLQPYLRDLTPREVGDDYDNLVWLVENWVTKFMKPWLNESRVRIKSILRMANDQPTEVAALHDALKQHHDLINASYYPETDEDIIIALVLRYLWQNVIQSDLYGCLPDYGLAIGSLEDSLQNHVIPKRDIFTIRNWKAEAYNALLSNPKLKGVLQDRREDLTVDLVEKLSIFCGSEDFEWFLDGTYENCILPAAKLNEKIMVSVHEVLPDIRIFTEVNQRGRFVTSPQFFASVTEMDCQNLLRDRKSFSLQKLDKTIQPGELEANLFCVCAVVPGLKLHRAGRGGRDSEPIVLRKQRVLMGWGTKEERRGFRQER